MVLLLIVAGGVDLYVVFLPNNVPSPSSLCLVIVPNNATIGYNNGTNPFFSVAYSNDTAKSYPVNTCPQPVNARFSEAVSAVEMNSTFVRDENGTRYIFDNWNSVLSPIYYGTPPNEQGYLLFAFTLYGNFTEVICGGLRDYVAIGRIVATVPLGQNGTLNTPDVSFQKSYNLDGLLVTCF